MTPELSRPIIPEQLAAGGQSLEVVATAGECAALAQRLQIPAVRSLRCTFRLQPGFGGAIDATGDLRAKIVQTCVVTLEDFPATVAERFALRFVPAGRETFDADPDSIDEIPYEPGRIDLGETAAEQLALALDPYPRRPGAALEDGDTGAKTPFAALAALKFRGPPD